MADLTATARRFRAQVLAGDRDAANALIRAYGQTYEVLQQQTAALLAKMQAAQTAGQPIRLSWLYEQQRLLSLQQQALSLFDTFATQADATVVAQQQAAAALGEQQAATLLREALAGAPTGSIAAVFHRLPAGAVQELVGTLRDGSPLKALFDTFGPEAARQLETALVTGVATGQGPPQVARAIRQSLGGNLTRALTISRTEVLRAYRTSSLQTYQANGDVLAGWVWMSTLGSGRTCAFCVSMSGSFHRLDEPFRSHVNCRCTPAPRLRSVASDATLDVPDGETWFAAQPQATQLARLGPAKYAAYRDGRITLADLRGFRTDPRWGPVGYEASLQDALANARRRLARAA